MKNLFKWSMLFLVVALFAGCASTQKTGDGDTGGAPVEDSGAQTTRAGEGSGFAGSLEDPDSPLYNKVVLFDFDKSEIRPEYVDMLRAHGAYLAANPSVSVTVEGHCDERGSREYNVGLGERRANSVKQFLEAEGASSSQISTISYGEERPVDPGHTEAAWSQNRRGVLAY